MAVSQISNPGPVNQPPSQPTFQQLRNHAGVITQRRAPDHIGWRLVAAAVRRYRALSPEARAILRAFFVALLLAVILIRMFIVSVAQ